MLNIKRVGVIGAGTMGNGIAQVFAQKGFEVQLVDMAAPALDSARTSIEKSLDKFVEKSKLTRDERDATLRASPPAPALTPLPAPTTSSKPSSSTRTPSARCSRGSTR